MAKTFLKANWHNIVMINYEVLKETLLPYLPYGVTLDDFEGKYYVSLVGFTFLNSTLFGIPMPIYGSFDEVNLRFYVKRKVNNEYRRGVVFISEIVPYSIVALLANKLYKEHYTKALMESSIEHTNGQINIKYQWEINDSKYSIDSNFEDTDMQIIPGSHVEFIYEHYYGYTKVNDGETWEYKVNHERWHVNKHLTHSINCNFENLYGNAFSFLNNAHPHSVYNAVGSKVYIDWHITKLKA